MSEAVSTELVAAATTPTSLIHHAGEVANVCKAIVESTALQIQGRKFVRVEGWQAIAIAHGCVASAGDVRRVEGGFCATGEVRVRDTGAVIATAEGFVGNDEKMWASRPEYAQRAMAQTRAISRVCRSAFAHVVVMMNAGLETTPAEEMPDDDDHRSKGARNVTAKVISPEQRRALADAVKQRTDAADIGGWLLAVHGFESSKQITVEKYAGILKRVCDPKPLREPSPPNNTDQGSAASPDAEDAATLALFGNDEAGANG